MDTFCPTYVTDPSHWPMFCKDNDKYTSIACRKTCKFCISSHEGNIRSCSSIIIVSYVVLSYPIPFYSLINFDVVTTTKASTQRPTEIETTSTTETVNLEGKHRLCFDSFIL